MTVMVSPKGETRYTESWRDLRAGQKKKTTVTAIWGKTSTYGSHRLRKTVRCITPSAPFRGLLLVGGREFLEEVVGLGHGVVQSLLGRLLAREDVLELALDDFPDLDEVAQPEALAVGRGLALGQLGKGRPLVRVLLEVIARLEILHGAVRDGEIARGHVPPHLLVGLRDELEEPGRPAVLVGRLALHDPEGRAPDYGRGLGIRRAPVRQLARAPRELDAAGEAADERRGLDIHRALAVDELRVGDPLPAAVGIHAVLLPGRQLRNVLDAQLLVDEELDVQPVEAVVRGGEGLIVPGVHVL